MAVSAITARIVGGGTDSYTTGSLREDLANFITLQSAEKTPFLSSLSTNKATSPNHQWQTDVLADPSLDAFDPGIELSDVTAQSYTAKRLNNYTQTFAKRVDIDGSTLRSNPAGAKDWFQYEVKKAKIELQRNIESKMLNYEAANVPVTDVVYDPANTRKMATLPSFAATWNLLDATASPQFKNAAGVVNAISTDSQGEAIYVANDTNADFGAKVVQTNEATPTNVSLNLDHLNSVFQVVSENGGDLNMAMIPTGLKQAVSDLLIAGNGGAAERRASEMAKRLNIMVDSVLVEFGFDITLHHNYIMQNFANDATSSLYLFDIGKLYRTILEPYTMEMDRQARKGKASLLFCEETLEARDPSSIAVITNASV